jgi:CRP-like cAMP-binding protein
MSQIVFVGATPPHALLDALLQQGATLTLVRPGQSFRCFGLERGAIALVSLDDGAASVRAAQMALRRDTPWLAWNRSDDQTLTLLAYAAGASAVLPCDLTASVLMQAIATTLGPQRVVERQPPHLGAPQHRYRRGTIIRLEPDMLLDIARGVVAQTRIHADGSDVLLGLYGPGQLLTGHPDDMCSLQLVAHTDVVATARCWPDLAGDVMLAERLRTRIQLMEAWVSAQARPYLDERIRGLLELLAEQFGVARPEGTLVDLRLTHAQIASAIGATRSTVTRLVGDLRTRGVLTTIGDGERERFCLPGSVSGRHLGATRRSQLTTADTPVTPYSRALDTVAR